MFCMVLLELLCFVDAHEATAPDLHRNDVVARTRTAHIKAAALRLARDTSGRAASHEFDEAQVAQEAKIAVAAHKAARSCLTLALLRGVVLLAGEGAPLGVRVVAKWLEHAELGGGIERTEVALALRAARSHDAHAANGLAHRATAALIVLAQAIHRGTAAAACGAQREVLEFGEVNGEAGRLLGSCVSLAVGLLGRVSCFCCGDLACDVCHDRL